MKKMYKDNAGNWHYGYRGEKLTEVSYSTNSVPNSIPIERIKNWAEPMPIGNDENAIMPYETPKVNWEVDGYIPIEYIKKWNSNYIADTMRNGRTIINQMLEDWEKENPVTEGNYDSDEEYEEQMRCLDEN